MKFKIILLLILAVLSLGAFAAAASAHDSAGKTGKAKTAHYYVESYSNAVWQDWFSGRCGNGTLWRCDWRGSAWCGLLRGEHSRYCQYSWGESYAHGHWYGIHWHYRPCTLNGLSYHGQPNTWDESCG